MKPIILLLLLITSSFGFAQNADEVYFNVNLKDHQNDQLLHVDINPVLSYMLNINLKGHNFLGLGRYTIDEMTFKVSRVPQNNLDSPIQVPQQLYFKSIEFVCFTKEGGKCKENPIPLRNLTADQPRSNGKQSRVAHFNVNLTTDPKKGDSKISEKVRFSLFENAIVDFHIKINGKNPVDFLREIAPGILNFGGHICKTRINY